MMPSVKRMFGWLSCFNLYLQWHCSRGFRRCTTGLDSRDCSIFRGLLDHAQDAGLTLSVLAYVDRLLPAPCFLLCRLLDTHCVYTCTTLTSGRDLFSWHPTKPRQQVRLGGIPTLLDDFHEGCNFLNLRWIWNCILWLHRKPPQQMLSALWSSLAKKLPLVGPIPIPFDSLGWRLWLPGRRAAKEFSSWAWTRWPKTLKISYNYFIIIISLYRVQIGYHSYDWSFKSPSSTKPSAQGALHPRSGTADGNPD